MMNLTNSQRKLLILASKESRLAVEAAIDVIKQENPDAFQTRRSLAMRVFLDEPANGEPYLHAIRVRHSTVTRRSVMDLSDLDDF